MARQAAVYLIMGSLAATFVQCGSDRSKEQQAAIVPVPTSVEPSMTPAAGTIAPAPAAPTAESAPPAAEAASPAAPERKTLSDGQIAAMTDAANSAEIEQAKLAQKTAKNAQVKKFAAMMIKDHTQAKQKQQKLLDKLAIAPSVSPMSTELETQSQRKLEELKALKGAEFDRAYIDAQVEAHQKVLDAFDNQLIPDAKEAELKALLAESRAKTAAHLAEAKQIQKALLEAASSPSPGQPGKTEGQGTKGTTPEQKGRKY